MTKKQRATIAAKIRELKVLEGRKLVGFKLLPALDSNGKGVTFFPTFVFEGGKRLSFKVEESEEWEDGVTPYIEDVN